LLSRAIICSAQVANLADLHQLGHRPDRLLDRDVRVDPVLIEEVNVIDAEPLERSLAGASHVVRASVGRPVARGIRIDHEPELGRDLEVWSRRSAIARPTSFSLLYGP